MNYLSAISTVNRSRRARWVRAPVRRKFIMKWVDSRRAGRSVEESNKAAFKLIRGEYKNPAIWMIVEMIFKLVIIPALIRWIEDR